MILTNRLATLRTGTSNCFGTVLYLAGLAQEDEFTGHSRFVAILNTLEEKTQAAPDFWQ